MDDLKMTETRRSILKDALNHRSNVLLGNVKHCYQMMEVKNKLGDVEGCNRILEIVNLHNAELKEIRLMVEELYPETAKLLREMTKKPEDK